MSELYQEIVALAEQIRTNTAEGSNTAELVGSTLKKIADYIKARMVDEAEEAANDYTDGQVAAEAAARQSADQTLQGNIDTEASARQAADAELQGGIDGAGRALTSEISNRQSADQTLQGNIDTEASARQSADQTLQGNIDTVAARKLYRGAANGKVTIAIQSADGQTTHTSVDIYGASTNLAGVMTAADKTKLDNIPAADTIARKSDVTDAVDELNDAINEACGMDLSLSADNTSISLLNGEYPAVTLSTVTLLPASPYVDAQNPGKAGLMSAQDKKKLDNIPASVQTALRYYSENGTAAGVDAQTFCITSTLDVDGVTTFQQSVSFYDDVSFGGNTTALTPSAGDNSTNVATTAYVQGELASLAARVAALEQVAQ